MYIVESPILDHPYRLPLDPHVGSGASPVLLRRDSVAPEPVPWTTLVPLVFSAESGRKHSLAVRISWHHWLKIADDWQEIADDGHRKVLVFGYVTGYIIS